MFYVSDEFNCFFRRYFRNRSNFNPLGEFVDGNQDMFVAAGGVTKWSYSIETPCSEGPRWRNSAQDLSWQMLLFGKELASFAPLDEVFSISYGRGSIDPDRYALPTKLVDAAWQPHSPLSWSY
jgi:hypothetical protein